MSQRNLERFPRRNHIYNLWLSALARNFYWSFWAKLRKVFTTQTMGHKNPVKGEKIFDVIRISFKLDI